MRPNARSMLAKHTLHTVHSYEPIGVTCLAHLPIVAVTYVSIEIFLKL